MRPYPLAEEGCRSIHSLLLEGNDRVLVGPGSGRLVIATTARRSPGNGDSVVVGGNAF